MKTEFCLHAKRYSHALNHKETRWELYWYSII